MAASMKKVYHVVLTCYGNWMPDDPRGSWSATRKTQHGEESFDLAKSPPARLDVGARQRLARSFSKTVARYRIAVHECAVMATHVHLLISSADPTGDVRLLKGGAAADIRDARPGWRLWARGAWIEEITTESHLAAVRSYILANPDKSGLEDQEYGWLTPLERW